MPTSTTDDVYVPIYFIADIGDVDYTHSTGLMYTQSVLVGLRVYYANIGRATTSQ